jgi:hypothetical protein
MVQLQTVSIVPDTEATEYDLYVATLGPKYLRMDSFFTRAAMAPAMKKRGGGTRQVSTCWARYSRTATSPLFRASNKIFDLSIATEFQLFLK